MDIANFDVRCGFIKIYRSLLRHPIWTDGTPEQCIILIELLFAVNWQSQKWDTTEREISLHPGQAFISIRAFAEKCGHGVTYQNVRTAFKRFESLDFITQEPTKFGTLVTITNWEKYQHVDEASPIQKENGEANTIKKEKVKKEKKLKRDIAKEFAAGNEELLQSIHDWMEMRKKLKKPVTTDRALELNLKKLMRLSNGQQPIMVQIVNQSVMNGWQGFYPLKNKTKGVEESANEFYEYLKSAQGIGDD